MGRSLRRAKRTRPKVSVKGKRKPKTKSKMPTDLKVAAAADRHKLGLTSWDDQKSFAENYQQAKLIPDANASFGRNMRTDALKEKAKELSTVEDVQESAEVKECLHKGRPGYIPAAQRLTAHQSKVVQCLIEAHGDNVEAMVWDTKLNSMQLPASRLQKLLRSFREVPSGARHGFRAPHTHL